MYYVTSFGQGVTLPSRNQTLDPIPVPAGKGLLNRSTILVLNQDLVVIVFLSNQSALSFCQTVMPSNSYLLQWELVFLLSGRPFACFVYYVQGSVSESTICRTSLKWNLASCSINFLAPFDNTAAFGSICGVDKLFTGPTRHFAMIIRHQGLSSPSSHRITS